MGSFDHRKGGRSWQAFGKRKKCLQFFRWERSWQFATKNIVFACIANITTKTVVFAYLQINGNIAFDILKCIAFKGQ